jgi:hypothetical protein
VLSYDQVGYEAIGLVVTHVGWSRERESCEQLRLSTVSSLVSLFICSVSVSVSVSVSLSVSPRWITHHSLLHPTAPNCTFSPQTTHLHLPTSTPPLSNSTSYAKERTKGRESKIGVMHLCSHELPSSQVLNESFLTRLSWDQYWSRE